MTIQIVFFDVTTLIIIKYNDMYLSTNCVLVNFIRPSTKMKDTHEQKIPPTTHTHALTVIITHHHIIYIQVANNTEENCVNVKPTYP